MISQQTTFINVLFYTELVVWILHLSQIWGT